MADLLVARGRPREAEERLLKALELDPGNPTTLTELGQRRLAEGDLNGAAARAREALESQPDHVDALVVQGTVALRRGDVQTAREHVAWALRQDAEHHGALHLIASIKFRTHRLLGAWWRYATWMGSLGDGRAIVVLLGAFVVYRLATIWAGQAGHVELAALIQMAWLGLCVYTWVGPGLFRRSLKREIGSVTLDRSF